MVVVYDRPRASFSAPACMVDAEGGWGALEDVKGAGWRLSQMEARRPPPWETGPAKPADQIPSPPFPSPAISARTLTSCHGNCEKQDGPQMVGRPQRRPLSRAKKPSLAPVVRGAGHIARRAENVAPGAAAWVAADGNLEGRHGELRAAFRRRRYCPSPSSHPAAPAIFGCHSDCWRLEEIGRPGSRRGRFYDGSLDRIGAGDPKAPGWCPGLMVII